MTDLDDLNLDCVICKEHFYFPILTPCGHHFCKDCILNWIDMNDYPSCPICKTRFPSLQMSTLKIVNTITLESNSSFKMFS